MNYEMSFKIKSQIPNYLSKNNYKQKNNNTSNKPLITEKNTNKGIVDYFRKGDFTSSIKFNTGKNSPKREVLSQDKLTESCNLSKRQNDQLIEVNLMLSQSNINNIKKINKKKDKGGVDTIFKKKMKMIESKKNDHTVQLTYTNAYNNTINSNNGNENNSSKIKLEHSLYLKVNKNESFVKKNMINSLIEEDDYFNYNQNTNHKAISQRINHLLEQDISKEQNNINTTNQNSKMKAIYKRESFNTNKPEKVNNYILNNKNGNGCNNTSGSNNQGKITTKQTTYHSFLIDPNTNTKRSSKVNSHNSNDNYFNTMIQIDTHLSREYKKKSHTALASPNNSSKNSIDKNRQVYYSNINNQSASTLKINKNPIANKYIKSTQLSSSSNTTKWPTSSLGKNKNKANEECKNQYQCIYSNKKRKLIEVTTPSLNNLITLNHLSLSPRMQSSRLQSSLLSINQQEPEINIDHVNYSNSPKQNQCHHIESLSPKQIDINSNHIKYNDCIASNIKNQFLKNSLLSNEHLKKNNEEIEKEYFYSKIKAPHKNKKIISSSNSKHYSKSNSRVEDFFINPLSNANGIANVKLNEEEVKGIGNKSDKLNKNKNKNFLAIEKLADPISMYQSPISKNAQAIINKINIKSPRIESQKQFIKIGQDYIKKSLNNNSNSNQLVHNHQYEEMKVNDIVNMERIINETTDSVQSTMRESLFYKKELEKISLYIKQYYKLNKMYPPSKIQFYKCGRLIGRGAFGKVNLALHICTGRIVAMKSFNKSKNTSNHSLQKIKNEIDILKQLHHPFVSQILDHFETDKYIVIVMDYICGDLLSFIRKRGKVSEQIAKVIFKQVIEGLKYIHNKKIVHRDIKLDNILIDLDSTVKICDFGVSKKISMNTIMYDHCGTPAYIAPEIFNKKGYDGYSCDIWSAGVTLFYMLTGNQPFKGTNIQSLNSSIMSGNCDKLDSVSLEVRDLIDGMLQVDPKKRLSVKQILSHPWLVSVNLKNRSQFNLFTIAEKVLLGKHNVDYLNSNKEDIIENFTYKNLDTRIEEENMNDNSKSLIFAPFNTGVDSKDSFLCSDIRIMRNISRYCGKVKQLNIKYELNNNGDFDNGIIITQNQNTNKNEIQNHILTSFSYERDSFSKSISPNVELEDIRDCFSSNNGIDQLLFSDRENDDDNHHHLSLSNAILNEIEILIGYKAMYLIDCLKKNEINYATATYYLIKKNDHQYKYK